jgi:thiol:disulfide interchange protein DsbD
MGSALGFALGQPAWVTLVVFTALGLGMASPYLLLSRFPALMRFLPRPGAWMESFKQLMGFFMMATAVALLWLFGRQTGVDSMTVLLTGLVVVGLGAWVYGRATAPGSTGSRKLWATLASLVLVAAGLGLGFSRAQASPGGAAGTDGDGIAWEPWSQERVAELRAAGTPVFVDFTADWCLSCQVNERVAFGSEQVQARFREAGIVPLKADWTLKDERITRGLAAHGRQGVPLYVLYAPGQPPRLLPELLTPGIVLTALDESL